MPGRADIAKHEFPLYLLAAPFALLSAFLFYRASIITSPNHCTHCNYDLTGIDTDNAPCPECGNQSTPG